MNNLVQDLKVETLNYGSTLRISVYHADDILRSLNLVSDNFSDFTESENWEGLRCEIECDELFAALAENYNVCKWIADKSAKPETE